MIIVGIDPGIADMGFGVIETDGVRHKLVDYGVIKTSQSESTPVRLKQIYDGVASLLDNYKPDGVAIEELFYFKNQKTVITIAEARGVILVASIERCGKLFEFTPLQVKQAMTGYGRAEKKQIQQMVKVFLNLKEIPKPDDAADALAIAITCAQTQKLSALYSI